MTPRRVAAFVSLLSALGLGAGAIAAPKEASSTSASPALEPAPPGSAPKESAATPERVLGSLPKPPSLEIPPPDPASIEALDGLLANLVSRDPGVRETAVSEILETERDRLPAIHRRLVTLSESSDHEGMKEVLGSVRDRTRGEIKGEKEGDERDKALDYLAMLHKHAKPDSKNWRDLVQVVAMSRMLRQMDTVGAARELISIYARFGEFLRLEMQRQVEKMGDHAVAALIEAGRHPAPKIAQWASRQLDALGKAIPGEAIQTSDPEALADILRAYGRAREPDAARLVISFANSERTQIRQASREATVLMGEVANWQLRDTYENVVGKKPPREWGWERTARELFGEFDRLRLAQVHAEFEQGLADASSGKLDSAAAAFDKVLARNPVFERAAEMVPGYLAYANAHLEDSPEAAVRALHRVERLAPEGDVRRKKATSLIQTLEAESLLARHVADQTLLRRALDLDPENARAKRLLERMSQGDTDTETRFNRYAAAGAVGFAALVALLFIAFRKRPARSAEPASRPRESAPPAPGPATTAPAEEPHETNEPGGDPGSSA
ncbi:MAG TPA: hypothetical protein VHE30_17450 [Polyangiaceae bacterium]|nr:hypothetical protein [Polyangiaceae bacterium]